MGKTTGSQSNYCEKQEVRRLARYRRKFWLLLFLTISLEIGAIVVSLYVSIIVALLLGLGGFITGILLIMLLAGSEGNTGPFRWTQNTEWSIMNRSGREKDDDHPDWDEHQQEDSSISLGVHGEYAIILIQKHLKVIDISKFYWLSIFNQERKRYQILVRMAGQWSR